MYLEGPDSLGTLSLWLGSPPQAGLQHTPPSHLAPSARGSKCNSFWFCTSHLGSARWRGARGGLCRFEARTQTPPLGRNFPRRSKAWEECCWSALARQTVWQKEDLRRDKARFIWLHHVRFERLTFTVCGVIIDSHCEKCLCATHRWYWDGNPALDRCHCVTLCSQKSHSDPRGKGRRSGCPQPCSTHLESVHFQRGTEFESLCRLWSRRKRQEEGRNHPRGI